MESIDYAERVAEATLKEARAAYDTLHERAYKFVALLSSAGGAVAVYALGKLGQEHQSSLEQVAALGSLSLTWFALAGVLLVRGVASREMKAGSTSDGIRARLARHLHDGGNITEDAALLRTRWDQLAAVDAQIAAYAREGSSRARAIDRTCIAFVLSPLAAVVGYAVAICLK